MRKTFLFLIFIASVFNAGAKPVTVEMAQAVATNFLSNKENGCNLTLELTKSYASTVSTEQTAMYIFNVKDDKGFVIVSGDDAVRPVLAYSTKNIFPADITNKEVAYWLNGYVSQISDVISKQQHATKAIAAAWDELTTGQSNVSGNMANKPTDISPLLLSEWDQMNPYSGGNSLYNNLCPDDAPSGCVATAMAQIMYYWQHPAVGTGSHSYNSAYGGTQTANFGATTYDWANMPPTLLNNPTTTQKNAVAKLMYHCGVSVDMNYGIGGSGAWVIAVNGPVCSENALKNYFGYKSTIQGEVRADYTDSQWVKMLKFELDNGRPTLCTGWGQVGAHAFVFDGYDNNDFFHVNWGWSGQSDGYFTIDDLSPSVLGAGGGGGNFNDNQQALVMIEPASSILPPNPFVPDLTTSNSADLVLAAVIMQSADTIVYNHAFSFTAKVKNEGTSDFNSGYLAMMATNTNNQNNIFLLDVKIASIAQDNTYTYSYSSNGNSQLVAGTYEITYLYSNDGNILNASSVGNGVAQNSSMMTVVDPTGISGIELENGNLKFYPNPAANFITLDWSGFNGKVAGIQLFNILGQEVYHSETFNTTNIKVSVQGFTSGNYSMRIVTDKGIFARKITVKQ